MTFDLVEISRTKDERGKQVYRSFVQFDGRAGTRVFVDKLEMVAILRGVLETQFGAPPLLDLLLQIEAGCYRFTGQFALDLTAEQAKRLGWA